MSEKQFLKTAERVRCILERDPYSREDDIYLTWQYWKDLDPLLEDMTMRDFKVLFLSGYFGVPASVTRARALTQNKTNPELRARYNNRNREDRADIFRRFFSAYPLPPGEDLEVVQNCFEGDLLLDEMRSLQDLREKIAKVLNRGTDNRESSPPWDLADRVIPEIPPGVKFYRGTSDGSVEPIGVTSHTIEISNEMKGKKTFTEGYISLGEYIAKHLRVPRTHNLVIDHLDAAALRDEARKICETKRTPPVIRKGSGLREGLSLEAFPPLVLDEVFKNYLIKKGVTNV